MISFTSDDAFDAAIALHFYCAHYHGGQASREYEILCKLQTELGLRLSPLMTEPDESAQPFYDYLEESKDVETFYAALKKAMENGISLS